MASIKNLYSSRNLQPGFESNYGVDFVVLFKLPPQGMFSRLQTSLIILDGRMLIVLPCSPQAETKLKPSS